MRSWIRWGGAALGCVVGAAVVGTVALKLAPDQFASDTACQPGTRTFNDCLSEAKARAEDRRGVTTATLALFAGAISIFGAYVGARTYALNRNNARDSHALDQSRQITERFTRAIDQLGDSALDVRLGGIYALERIARDSADDHPQIVEVLTAYIREHSPWPPKASVAASAAPADAETPDRPSQAIQTLERITTGSQTHGASTKPPDTADPSDEDEAPPLATDVQAAMSVLGRRDPSRDRANARLQLAHTDLRRLVLLGDQALLDGAQLDGANLQGAQLDGANLRGARLEAANLRGARLEAANLEGADLHRAHLLDARLREANLRGASLDGANLEGAHLHRAHLKDARLHGANLERASLRRANLEGAWLVGAHLERADLAGAHVEDAMYATGSTTWPERFDPKAAGARSWSDGGGDDGMD